MRQRGVGIRGEVIGVASLGSVLRSLGGVAVSTSGPGNLTLVTVLSPCIRLVGSNNGTRCGTVVPAHCLWLQAMQLGTAGIVS